MNAPAPPPGSPIWRDVLVIVLAGSALGAGYNQVQLRSGEPGKGLAWVKTQPRLASLESLLADSAATPPAAASAASASTSPPEASSASPAAPTPAAQELAAKPHAAARDTIRKPVPGAPAGRTAATTPAAPATAPASAPAPAPAASAAPTAAADVPAIPDTREPLEVQYPIVKKLFDAGAALFVDARSPEEFAEGHIRGAVNLPFDDVFKKPDLAKQLADGGRPIVAYCGGGDCELSRNLAFALIEGGHRKVLVFLGGTAGWTAAGQALEKGSGK